MIVKIKIKIIKVCSFKLVELRSPIRNSIKEISIVRIKSGFIVFLNVLKANINKVRAPKPSVTGKSTLFVVFKKMLFFFLKNPHPEALATKNSPIGQVQ